jgi:hypothetical protein
VTQRIMQQFHSIYSTISETISNLQAHMFSHFVGNLYRNDI